MIFIFFTHTDIIHTIYIIELYNKWSCSSCSNVTVTNLLFYRKKTKSSRNIQIIVGAFTLVDSYVCMWLYQGLLSINVIINNNTKLKLQIYFTHNFAMGN